MSLLDAMMVALFVMGAAFIVVGIGGLILYARLYCGRLLACDGVKGPYHGRVLATVSSLAGKMSATF